MTLQTDAPVLAREAANFERIAEALKTVLARVESTAAEMDSHWQGTAAKAAQSAISRFHEAASAQVQQLNDISTNIQTAGAQYSATDDERAGAIAGAMAPAMGTAGTPSGAASPPTAAPNGQVHPATATDAANGSTHNGVRLVDFKTDGGPQPSPQPSFIDQYQRQVTSAGAQPLPPPIPMPSSGRTTQSAAPQAPGPMPAAPAQPSFGQCVGDHVRDSVGEEMVKDAFKSAGEKAAIGAAGGAMVTPEAGGAGALPGAVLGWVGGFGQGLLEAPIEAAAKGAWECADGPPIPGVTK